ncbi:hypothetical protein NPIL_115181 [Nephila pilipes]|uniref:Uncharacterized protein n=1 Tax=Nephila pilipes TaxID=299642 RepID=A0A8X6P8C1_NEPPI|nr:hypothetical protein NPIL_115181 [Nephila pilipes]
MKQASFDPRGLTGLQVRIKCPFPSLTRDWDPCGIGSKTASLSLSVFQLQRMKYVPSYDHSCEKNVIDTTSHLQKCECTVECYGNTVFLRIITLLLVKFSLSLRGYDVAIRKEDFGYSSEYKLRNPSSTFKFVFYSKTFIPLICRTLKGFTTKLKTMVFQSREYGQRMQDEYI